MCILHLSLANNPSIHRMKFITMLIHSPVHLAVTVLPYIQPDDDFSCNAVVINL